MQKTVLITGGGGVIGTLLRGALEKTYTLRLLSLQPVPGVDDSIVANINDLPALLEAFQGVDSVIHLAAQISTGAEWNDVLQDNIIGTYNVFEAAARCGVRQVIYASSNHVVGTHDLEQDPEIYQTGQPVLDHLVPVRPDSLYGVSKSFGESLGRYYADHRSMHVLCLRIGFVNRVDTPYVPATHESFERLAAIWLSHADTIQLFEKSLQADHVKFDIVYGISNNRPHYYDLEHAREMLGYVPVDGSDVALAKRKSPVEQPSQKQVGP